MERAVRAAKGLRADFSDLDARLPAPEVTDAEVIVARQPLMSLGETLTRRAASRVNGWAPQTKDAARALGSAEAAASRWVAARIAYAEQPGEGRLLDLREAESTYRESRTAALDALEMMERALGIPGRP
jgi:hypothetical protein